MLLFFRILNSEVFLFVRFFVLIPHFVAGVQTHTLTSALPSEHLPASQEAQASELHITLGREVVCVVLNDFLTD